MAVSPPFEMQPLGIGAHEQIIRPLIVVQRRRLLGSREDGQPRNCIAAVDRVAAKLLAIQGGWNTITTEHEGRIGDDTLVVAKMLVPAYLKDLSERRFDLGAPGSRRDARP